MEITLDNSKSAIILAEIAQEKCRVLIDTGASRSFIREDYFKKLQDAKLMPTLRNVRIRSATGRDVQTLGRTKAEVFFEDTYPKLKAIKCIDIQARSIMVITTKADFQIQDQGKIFEVKPTEEFVINHPNLITLPIIHKTDTENRENVPYLLINLANDDEHILKGEEIAIMEELMVNSDQIQREEVKQETKEQLKSDLKVRKNEIHFEEEVNNRIL